MYPLKCTDVTAKHRGVKDFVCPTCGKGFARRDILRRHEQGHAAKAAAANGGPSASSKKASKVKDEDDDGDYNNAGSSRGKKAARKPEAQQQQQQQQQQQYASAVGTSKSAAAAPVLGANGKPTRISRACARCSRQKLKCDGLDPCARCAKAKQVCSYDRGGGPGDGGSGGHKRRSSAAHGRGGAHKRARTDDDVDVEPEDASTRSLSILSASDDTHANESSSVLAPSAGAEPSVSPWDHPYALPQQPQQQAYGGGGASEYPHGLSPYLSGSLPGANNTTANNNSGAQGEHPFYSQKILPPPFSASAAGQPIPASAAQRNAARLPHQANTPVGLLSRGPLPFSSSFLGSATTNGAGAAHAAAHLNARGGGGPFLPPPASTSHAGNARATQGWNRGPGQADFGAFDVDLGPDQPFMPGLSSTTSASAVPALSAALAASGAAASNGELFSLPFHMGGDPSMNVGTTPSGGAPAWNAEHAATGARYDFLSSIASAGEESASLAAQQQQHALPGGTPADSSYMNALWGSVFGIDLESAASASRSRATSPQLQAPPPPPPQPPQQQQPQPQVDKRQLSSKSILHTQPLEEASETSSSYAEDLSKSSSQSQSSGAQRHARNNRLRVSAVAQAVGGGDSRSVAESLLRLAARRPDANSPHDDDDSEHPWPLSSRPAGAAQHPQTTNIAKLDAARASPGENGTVPLPERDEHGHESEEEEGEDEDEEDEDEILSRELEKDVVAAVTDETRERVLGGVLETTTGLLSTRELSRYVTEFGTMARPEKADDGEHSFIPSTKLLNHFLQLYFARFHALYPIIHRPTFDTNGAATYLLLALASIGARYSSVPLAQGYAHALSECGQHMLKVVCQLNHVILHTVAWQQASILLLLAGLSAGNRRDLERAQYYANLPVTSCRRQGWLVDEEIDSDEEKHYTLEDRWRRWRDRETLKRLGFAALMLDGMGSTLWNLETSFLFDDAAFSRMPCLNALWEATTPDAWQSLFRGSTQPTPSLTTLEVVHLLTDRTHHNSDKITALAHEHFLMVLALTVLNLLGFAKRRETHMSVLYLPSTAQFDRLSAIQSPTQASLTTGLDFFDEKVLLPPEIYSTLSEAKSTATGMILYAYVTRLTERMPLRVLQVSRCRAASVVAVD